MITKREFRYSYDSIICQNASPFYSDRYCKMIDSLTSLFKGIFILQKEKEELIWNK